MDSDFKFDKQINSVVNHLRLLSKTNSVLIFNDFECVVCWIYITSDPISSYSSQVA